jgi:hypothetical protein
MTIRKVLFAAACIAAISPAISYAAPEDSALKACAQAFASSLSSNSAPPTFKLRYRADAPGALAYYYSGQEYTFYLQANDPKTGSTLARATCSANTHGAVLALTATPLETSPALAAKL